jgi:hypothetical protein
MTTQQARSFPKPARESLFQDQALSRVEKLFQANQQLQLLEA